MQQKSWLDPERAVERVGEIQDVEASEACVRCHLPRRGLVPAQRAQTQAALL